MLWVVLAVVVVFGVLGTVVVARGRVAGRGRTQALPRPDSSPIPMSAPAARDTARVRPPGAPLVQVPPRVPASAEAMTVKMAANATMITLDVS